MATQTDIEIVQGQTKAFSATWAVDGTPKSLEGYEGHLQIRVRAGKYATAALIDVSSLDGSDPATVVIEPNGETGKVKVRLPGNLTAILNKAAYRYDLFVVNSQDTTERVRLVFGQVSVSKSATDNSGFVALVAEADPVDTGGGGGSGGSGGGGGSSSGVSQGDFDTLSDTVDALQNTVDGVQTSVGTVQDGLEQLVIQVQALDGAGGGTTLPLTAGLLGATDGNVFLPELNAARLVDNSSENEDVTVLLPAGATAGDQVLLISAHSTGDDGITLQVYRGDYDSAHPESTTYLEDLGALAAADSTLLEWDGQKWRKVGGSNANELAGRLEGASNAAFLQGTISLDVLGSGHDGSGNRVLTDAHTWVEPPAWINHSYHIQGSKIEVNDDGVTGVWKVTALMNDAAGQALWDKPRCFLWDYQSSMLIDSNVVDGATWQYPYLEVPLAALPSPGDLNLHIADHRVVGDLTSPVRFNAYIMPFRPAAIADSWAPTQIAAQPAGGKMTSGLTVWNNHLYVGYGDTNNNSGPISVLSLDLDNQEAGFVEEAVLTTEKILTFRPIDDRLYVTFADPQEGFGNPEKGMLAWRSADDPTWHTIVNTSPYVEHCYDVARTSDGLWITGLSEVVDGDSQDYPSVWRSTDDGDTWELSYQFESGAPSSWPQRLFQFGDRLYIVCQDTSYSAHCVEWNGTAWVDLGTSQQLFPDHQGGTLPLAWASEKYAFHVAGQVDLQVYIHGNAAFPDPNHPMAGRFYADWFAHSTGVLHPAVNALADVYATPFVRGSDGAVYYLDADSQLNSMTTGAWPSDPFGFDAANPLFQLPSAHNDTWSDQPPTGVAVLDDAVFFCSVDGTISKVLR